MQSNNHASHLSSELRALLKSFELDLKNQGMSDKTIKNYIADVVDFLHVTNSQNLNHENAQT